MTKLNDKVALVTGASRGVGRGIATGLGEAGATVYITGRSVSGETTEGLPGTIHETAALVDEAGGQGFPMRCDHTVDAQTESAVARIAEERGQLDILVNNVWGGYENYDQANWELPFWEEPLAWWDGMFSAGVRAHYVTSRVAAPLMLNGERGLIVNISASYGDQYMGSVMYETSKKAVDRMAWAMAQELRERGVAAVSVHPGFTRTERVLQAYEQAESSPEHMEEMKEITHSPLYVGRAVAALAADEAVMEKTGQALPVGELALEYGFTDVDGRQPQWPPKESGG